MPALFLDDKRVLWHIQRTLKVEFYAPMELNFYTNNYILHGHKQLNFKFEEWSQNLIYNSHLLIYLGGWICKASTSDAGGRGLVDRLYQGL